ncbi:MAG: ABC transporter permease [Candidatus Bathyarchaeia archaeon]
MKFSLYFEKRIYQSKLLTILVSITSIAVALMVVALIFLAYGIDPLQVYWKIFVGAFGSFYGLSETIVKAIPLMLCGLGLAMAFKALFWNIGAEGQLLLGAIAATWVALSFPDAPSYILLPSMFAIGFISGALWCLIPAILKSKLNINEIITTLMMNYIALELLKYLVYGPWKGPEEWGFPYTTKFSPSAQLPRLFNTRIHYPTLILALLLAILIYILITKTKLGYEIRVVGENPWAAKYSGISYSKVIIIVALVSGGLAGVAGVGEVAGIQYRLRLGVSGAGYVYATGYGYVAIIVAWLGKLNSLGVILSSLLFGGLLIGGDAIQLIGLPVAAVNIFNGIILLFVLGGEVLARYKIKLRR